MRINVCLPLIALGLAILLAGCDTTHASPTSTTPAPSSTTSLPTSTPTTTFTPTTTATPTLTPTPEPSPTPTETATPTPEPWMDAAYWNLTFERADGTPRFPADVSRINNTMDFETAGRLTSEAVEFETMMAIDPDDEPKMQAWGQAGLSRIAEAGGWDFPMELDSALDESMVGILDNPKFFLLVSPDAVHPLAMARNSGGEGFVAMYAVEHEGVYSVFFLKINYSLSALWIIIDGDRHYIVRDNDNPAAVTDLHAILKGISTGESPLAREGGVIATPVLDLGQSN